MVREADGPHHQVNGVRVQRGLLAEQRETRMEFLPGYILMRTGRRQILRSFFTSEQCETARGPWSIMR